VLLAGTTEINNKERMRKGIGIINENEELFKQHKMNRMRKELFLAHFSKEKGKIFTLSV